MELPTRLKNKLAENHDFESKVNDCVGTYSKILESNRMYFFPEYTDHGIGHIKRVLEIVEELIPKKIFRELNPKDVGVIIFAVIFHDMGMHTSPDMFKNMIDGKYDKAINNELGDRKWKELWEEFIKESKYWDSEKIENIFGEKKEKISGEKDHDIDIPNLENLRSLKTSDNMFIGEFIRKHHHRLADDIAKLGYIGNETIAYQKKSSNDDFVDYLKIAGIVARSHGMDLRDISDHIKNNRYYSYGHKRSVHIIYLMVLLRLADYLDITKDRTNTTQRQLQKLYSPFSRLEHEGHDAIKTIFYGTNPAHRTEIVLEVDYEDNPDKVKAYVKIKKLVNDIQEELDKCWAVLGECYENGDFTLNFRRIKTIIKDEDFEKEYGLVPRQFKFRLNDELAKLLVEPLYGDNPSFGVRELVQNAVDACRECINVETDESDFHVEVKLDTTSGLFTIKDTGKGMTLEEIEKYFLTIGSSYNDNVKWKQMRDEKHIYRTGRFGIGALASFLIGDEIAVETKSRTTVADGGYKFKISLENKFVEISKENNIDYGTKIEIKCKKNCLNQFKSPRKESEPYYWLDWYVDEKPTVNYYVDGKVQYPNKSYLEGFWELNKHKKGLGLVRFKTNKLFYSLSLHIISILSETPNLICNGFFITGKSNKKVFSLPYVSSYYPFGMPSLQIIDIHNKLPLNLRRTNINENVKYEFEEDLAVEVCKDLICQLMVINDLGCFFGHFSNMFYLGNDGFAFNNLYTNKQLSNKHIIWLGLSSSTIEKIINIVDNNIIGKWYQYYDNKKECLFAFRDYGKIDQPLYAYGYKINPKDDEEYEEAKNAGDFPYNLLSNDTSVNDYNDYHIKYCSGKDDKLIKTFIDFMNKFDIRFIFVGVSDIKLNISLEDPETLNENENKLYLVFDKYFNRDPIIPYNFEDRRTKFTNIFEDKQLSQQIEYYKNIYSTEKGGLLGRTISDLNTSKTK